MHFKPDDEENNMASNPLFDEGQKINKKPKGKVKKDPYGNRPLPISNRPFFELWGLWLHQARTYKIICLFLVVVTTISVIWAMSVSKELKTVPFVILKDNLGNLTPLGVASGNTQSLLVDERSVVSSLSLYVKDVHSVIPNQDLMLYNIKQMLSMTKPEVQVKVKGILYDQVKLAGSNTVLVTPTQVIKIPGVKNGWKIDWTETQKLNSDTGLDSNTPVSVTYWEATLIVDYLPQGSTDTEGMMLNPLGMQVTEINISKLVSNNSVDTKLSNAIVNQNQPVADQGQGNYQSSGNQQQAVPNINQSNQVNQ